MPEPTLKVRVDGCSGSIILNRPHRQNALSRSLLLDIQQAFSDLHQEKRVCAVILTGTGNAFCAGLDLHEMHDTVTRPEAEAQWHADAIVYRDLMLTMLRFPKPIIAGVNGATIGAGAGLMLACDIVVASEQASFSVPAPRRGLVAGMVIPLLVFRAGGGLAAPLLLACRRLDASTAQQSGLFHELVRSDVVWARCQQIAEECAIGAPEAVAMTKRMLNEMIGESLSTLLSTGAAMTATAKTTEAASEGIRAFVEKRQPVWP